MVFVDWCVRFAVVLFVACCDVAIAYCVLCPVCCCVVCCLLFVVCLLMFTCVFAGWLYVVCSALCAGCCSVFAVY